MLRVLRELPFLVPSTCHYLGRYFGHEGRTVDGKARFWEENQPVLDRALGPDEAARCFDSFRVARGAR